MSFKQLRNISEPKRIYRGATQVRTSQLNIDAFKDSVYYYFNFKSSPSTEHKRHKGYVKFIKPRYATTRIGGKGPRVRKQLQDLPCVVDCDCKDMRYRFAWVLKQKRAGKVGPNSLNQAHNRAPFKTNPGGMISLCKHLLAMSNFIYGQITSFQGNEEMGLPDKLDKLLRQSRKYTIEGDVRNPKVVKGEVNQPPPEREAPEGESPLPEPNVNPQNAQNRQNHEPEEQEEAQEFHVTDVGKGKEPPSKMKTISKELLRAQKLIEEIEASEPIVPDSEFGGVGDEMSPEQPETEGEEAIALLTDIRDLLSDLVGNDLEDEVPPEEEEEITGDEISDATDPGAGDFKPGDEL